MLAEALARWQHAAGPFWPYVCAAPFLGTGEGAQLAEQASRDRPRGPGRLSGAQRALVDRLLAQAEAGAASSSDDGSFPVVLADLPAEPLLRVASTLAAQGWYVVPVVQRWIASPAVLPCRQLVAQLVYGAWQTRRPVAPRGALLIADGERFGPAGYPLLVAGGAFDNRYEYQICRFPSIRFLEAQGVRRVTWLTAPGLEAPALEAPALAPGGSVAGMRALGIPPVARDLHPYRETLLLAGIDVDIVAWGPG